jgi:phosphoserine phosphatase
MSLPFSSELQDFLEHYKRAKPTTPPIAVFDCDGTIIKGDIGEAMFYRQVENFQLRVNPANIWLDHPRRDELDTLYNALAAMPHQKRLADRRFVSFAEALLEWYFDQLSDGETEKACSDIVRLFAKYSEEETSQLARETFADESSAPMSAKRIGKHSIPVGIRYIEESVHLLRALQQLDFDVWAVSGSNVWAVRSVFEQLGVPRDHIVGIDLHSSNGAFIPKVQTPVPVLDGKEKALRQFTATPPVIVVSDSIYDIPLFQYSSNLKVLINSRMETSYTFFKEGEIVRDESWVVIESPTVTEEVFAFNG